MSLEDYAEVVTSVTLFRLEEEDRFLQRVAYQAAGIMISSGNYKKSAKVESIAESIYVPIVSKTASHEKAERVVSADPEEARQFVKQLEAKMNKQ